MKDKTLIDIGRKVEWLQQRKELTQYMLCKKAGVQPSQLKAIKTGEEYNISTLLKVLRVLNVNIVIL